MFVRIASQQFHAALRASGADVKGVCFGTKHTVRLAYDEIRAHELGMGGTQLGLALDSMVPLPTYKSGARIVVVFTDGATTSWPKELQHDADMLIFIFPSWCDKAAARGYRDNLFKVFPGNTVLVMVTSPEMTTVIDLLPSLNMVQHDGFSVPTTAGLERIGGVGIPTALLRNPAKLIRCLEVSSDDEYARRVMCTNIATIFDNLMSTFTVSPEHGFNATFMALMAWITPLVRYAESSLGDMNVQMAAGKASELRDRAAAEKDKLLKLWGAESVRGMALSVKWATATTVDLRSQIIAEHERRCGPRTCCIELPVAMLSYGNVQKVVNLLRTPHTISADETESLLTLFNLLHDAPIVEATTENMETTLPFGRDLETDQVDIVTCLRWLPSAMLAAHQRLFAGNPKHVSTSPWTLQTVAVYRLACMLFGWSTSSKVLLPRYLSTDLTLMLFNINPAIAASFQDLGIADNLSIPWLNTLVACSDVLQCGKVPALLLDLSHVLVVLKRCYVELSSKHYYDQQIKDERKADDAAVEAGTAATEPQDRVQANNVYQRLVVCLGPDSLTVKDFLRETFEMTSIRQNITCEDGTPLCIINQGARGATNDLYRHATMLLVGDFTAKANLRWFVLFVRAADAHSRLLVVNTGVASSTAKIGKRLTAWQMLNVPVISASDEKTQQVYVDAINTLPRAPTGDPNAPLELIVHHVCSRLNVALCQVRTGSVSVGDTLQMFAGTTSCTVLNIQLQGKNMPMVSAGAFVGIKVSCDALCLHTGTVYVHAADITRPTGEPVEGGLQRTLEFTARVGMLEGKLGLDYVLTISLHGRKLPVSVTAIAKADEHNLLQTNAASLVTFRLQHSYNTVAIRINDKFTISSRDRTRFASGCVKMITPTTATKPKPAVLQGKWQQWVATVQPVVLERVAAHGVVDATLLAAILTATTSNTAFKIDDDNTAQLNCIFPMISPPADDSDVNQEEEYKACVGFNPIICAKVQGELDSRSDLLVSALLRQFGVPVCRQEGPGDGNESKGDTDGVDIIDMNLDEVVLVGDVEDDVDEDNTASEEDEAVDLSEQKHDMLLQTVTCPITMEVMCDPVFDSAGNSYERAAILQHLAIQETSPLTREPLTAADLRPNRALKEMIGTLLAAGILVAD